MRKYLWVVLILAAAACSDSTANGGAHGQGKGSNLPSAGAGGSGTGNGGSGDLGNSVGNGGSSGVIDADASIECPVGQFCAPTTPDPNDCGNLTLQGDVKTVMMPGNVLMIFDRSGSMVTPWNGTARWQAAGQAMTTALMPLQDLLTIGAVFFPSDQGTLSCVVDPIASATQINFQPGAMALAKMATGGANGTPMYQPGLGSTPTTEGVMQADAALAGATLPGTTVVILITDGDPTCAWNEAGTNATIAAWLSAKNIKTYVVGLPGVNSAARLNALATSGGTAMAGAANQYLTPTDAAALQMLIKDIVVSTVKVGFDSCNINLTPAAMVPEKLHLIVKQNGMESDVPHEFSTGEKAWTVTADGSAVELVGNLCEAAKNGTYESIRFEFGCVELPPAPPPPVPE